MKQKQLTEYEILVLKRKIEIYGAVFKSIIHSYNDFRTDMDIILEPLFDVSDDKFTVCRYCHSDFLNDEGYCPMCNMMVEGGSIETKTEEE